LASTTDEYDLTNVIETADNNKEETSIAP